MIVGIGIDLVEIRRMAASLARFGDRLERKLFTDAERAYSRAGARPAERFAARFAAKEAALKALRVPAGLRWHELEVARDGDVPRLQLAGEAARAAARLGATRAHLSLTHAADVAAAVVILEGDGAGPGDRTA